MTHAYSETYLEGAMENLGDMLDYAMNDCGYGGDEFMELFLFSGIAEEFGNGNPKYVAGLSGPELAQRVITATIRDRVTTPPSQAISKSPEYWTGWALAWYQWYSGKPFSSLFRYGFTASWLLRRYSTLHEADLTKLAQVADEQMQNIPEQTANLGRIRKARGFSQRELSERSGVGLRSIQLYEQRKNDINKAQVVALVALAKTLKCRIEDLLE
jgi:Predicted transcriptional regulators